MQTSLPLNARDDYFLDRQQARACPRRITGSLIKAKCSIDACGIRSNLSQLILMGSDRNNAHYLGALDQNGRIVHSVDLPGGQNSAAMLKNLKKF
jgi:hypothetical protein